MPVQWGSICWLDARCQYFNTAFSLKWSEHGTGRFQCGPHLGPPPGKTCLPRKPEIVSERKHPPPWAPLLDESLMSTSYPWQDQVGWRSVPTSCGAQTHSGYSHDRDARSFNILTPPRVYIKFWRINQTCTMLCAIKPLKGKINLLEQEQLSYHFSPEWGVFQFRY